MNIRFFIPALFLCAQLAAPLAAQDQDVSFDDFFAQLLKEIEEETAAQEQKEPERTPAARPLAPAVLKPGAAVAPQEKAADQKTNFLRAYTPAPAATGEELRLKLPAFKEEALEHYLRNTRGHLEELSQAIGALDVSERAQFALYQTAINNSIAGIGQVLSKKVYERALFDTGFDHLRKAIVELERVFGGAVAEIERRAQKEELGAIERPIDVPSSIALVLKSIKSAFTHDIPTLGENLNKVLVFAQKSISEKAA